VSILVIWNETLSPGPATALETAGLRRVPGAPAELRGRVRAEDLGSIAADPRVLLVTLDHTVGLSAKQLRRRPRLDGWFLLGQPLGPSENADHDGDPHTAVVNVRWASAPTRREREELARRGYAFVGRQTFKAEITRAELGRLLRDRRVAHVSAVGVSRPF
jgi:hypothetical protein